MAASIAPNPTLVLSFYGDGPYWDNMVRVLAYPSECSYFRPFRYRDKWIEPSLLELLRSEEGRRELAGRETVLAARFQAPTHRSLLLPIRKVTVTHVSFTPGNASVYFTLGPSCEVDTAVELAKQCLTFDAAHSPPDDRLFFWATPQVLPAFVDVSDEDEAWVRWTEAIAADNDLPLSEEAKHAVFLRICRVRSKKIAPLEQVYRSWEEGPLSGFSLREGQVYELTYMHRVPCLINTGKSLPKALVLPTTATKNLEFAQPAQEIASNYQQHVCTFTAIAPSASWEEVVLTPNTEQVSVNGVDIYLRSVSFRLRVNRSFRRRFWIVHVWVILLGILLVLKETVGPYFAGKPTVEVLSGAAVAALATIVGLIVGQKALFK